MTIVDRWVSDRESLRRCSLFRRVQPFVEGKERDIQFVRYPEEGSVVGRHLTFDRELLDNSMVDIHPLNVKGQPKVQSLEQLVLDTV